MSETIREIVGNNDKNTCLSTLELLLKIVENVLREPQNDKFRRLRVANDQFENKILPVVGAFGCLLELGFVEDGEFLTLPKNADLVKLQSMRNELANARARLTGVGVTLASAARAPQRTVISAPGQREFFAQLLGYIAKVRRYEDVQLQKLALSKIPLERLKKAAEERFERNRSSGTAQADANSVLGDRDMFLVQELARWFKEEFFTWFDKPARCNVCGSTHFSAANKYGVPTAAELANGGNRVEVYACENGHEQRFVRFNEPAKLLETRCGRCGEWANAFGLVLRACGIEARIVYDSTDHLWNEVYSTVARRWCHVDASECKLDAPSLYEAGWGKQLVYVIAFSCDDLQDVTWRYVRTRNWPATLARRTACSERALLHFLLRQRAALQRSVSVARRAELTVRCIGELVELVAKRDAEPSADELEGRLSGSLEWRQSRGEAGTGVARGPPATLVGHSFKLLDPASSGTLNGAAPSFKLTVRYDCVRDEYEVLKRSVDPAGEEHTEASDTVKSYKSGAYSLTNTFRKVETDWKMAYLCREEGAPAEATGEFIWRFELGEGSNDSQLVIDQVRVFVSHAVFENGRIEWSLCDSVTDQSGSSKCHTFDGGFSTTDAFRGGRVVYLRARLSGGTGNCAWQHVQLFRQKMVEQGRPNVQSTRTTGSPFEVCIEFKRQ